MPVSRVSGLSSLLSGDYCGRLFGEILSSMVSAATITTNQPIIVPQFSPHSYISKPEPFFV